MLNLRWEKPNLRINGTGQRPSFYREVKEVGSLRVEAKSKLLGSKYGKPIADHKNLISSPKDTLSQGLNQLPSKWWWGHRVISSCMGSQSCRLPQDLCVDYFLTIPALSQYLFLLTSKPELLCIMYLTWSLNYSLTIFKWRSTYHVKNCISQTYAF